MAVTIGGTTGITIPASATNQSGAVAWVNFNGNSGASPVIRASYNVASVVRNSTGNYTITFSNSLADGNYGTTTGISYDLTSGSGVTVAKIVSQSSSTLNLITTSPAGAVTDSIYVSVAIFR
jgi:hypothetical protein